MKTEIPTHALSIRQPWAWLIVNGHKDIENRTWKTNFRGPVFIHASLGMTRAEYDEAEAVAAFNNVELPRFEELERGGIVGQTSIYGCASHSFGSWFTGPYGFMLEEAKPLPFQPCRGKLGFFKVEGVAA